MSEEILRTENLKFKYPEGPSFSFKDFSVSRGELINITGEMGTGKTTFAKLLCGLERPSSGKLFYKGEDVWKDKKSRLSFSGKASLLFQFSSEQLFEKTVLEDVMFGPLNRGLNRAEAEEAAKKALSDVSADSSLWNRDPFLLSGGQKKLISFAGVLAVKPEVIILDEVSCSLDKSSLEHVFRLLDKLRREEGTAVVSITHEEIRDGGVYEISDDK